MELEFDKEIDAILRKARVGVETAPKGEHLDADAIAAFAENALPQKMKALYTVHFADCVPCRKLLSQSMAWPPAEPKAATVVAPALGSSTSWFGGLFKTPNLALAMGALVLVFAGVLGIMVVRNRTADSNATVARIDDAEQPPAAYEPGLISENTNAAANIATNSISAANASSNTAVPAPTPGTGTGTAGRGPESNSESVTTTDTVMPPPSGAAQPEAVAPPAPIVGADAPTAEERRDENKEKDDADRSRESKTQYDGMSRDAKKISGPTRGSGPRLNQQNINSDLQMNVPVTGGARTGTTSAGVRSVGGKKFENRDGAWYDTSYRGQATKNVSRNSEDFNKLDGGLRSIARSIGGVVVVVWKGTAYRIQ
jgi:hypothetical protein